MRAPVKLFIASSNAGKLAEYRALGATSALFLPVDLELFPGFDSLPPCEENAPTFAENAVGKALYYSRLCEESVFADDSGLVVPSLGGMPGVRSARYAGEHATDSQRVERLLSPMRGKIGIARSAYFVCAIALAKRGRAIAIVTDSVYGEILEAPRGAGGFGYDPVFYSPAVKKTFAEISKEEKNQLSHRGKAFRRLLAALSSML